MKKIISVILILVCLGVFAGCAAEGAAPAAVPTGGTAANYEFAARYARTNGYIEDAGYPFVNIIRSHDELMAYYEAVLKPNVCSLINKNEQDFNKNEEYYVAKFNYEVTNLAKIAYNYALEDYNDIWLARMSVLETCFHVNNALRFFM